MLLYAVGSLVDHPDDAEIILLSHSGVSIFYIHIHPADVAKPIENGGQTTRALPCIVGAVERKLSQSPTLDIVQKQVDCNENALLTVRSLFISGTNRSLNSSCNLRFQNLSVAYRQ
jgi:predicted RNA-binding protein YlqC (UPF0109 family)